jgi:hypothetical protein
MAETVRVIAYKVEHCGLYHRGSAQPEFAGYPETLERLAAWIQERTIGESCTFVHPGSSEEDDQPLLCSNLAKIADDWLFEMWQRTSDAAGMGTLNLDARVGQAAAKSIRVGARDAAGVSRLFWLLPADRLLCTVQLKNAATARPEFQRYIRDFIKWGPWAVTEESEGGLKIRGWAADPDDTPDRLIPRFRIGTSVDLRKADQVRENREAILSILYRGRVEVNPAREKLRGLTGLLDDFIRVRVPLNAGKAFRLHMELPQTPTKEELEDLISEASNTDTRHPPDVGFRLAPDRRVVWLHARQANKVDQIEVRRLNPLQVDAEHLLRRLRAKFRDKLLGAIEEG